LYVRFWVVSDIVKTVLSEIDARLPRQLGGKCCQCECSYYNSETSSSLEASTIESDEDVEKRETEKCSRGHHIDVHEERYITYSSICLFIYSVVYMYICSIYDDGDACTNLHVYLFLFLVFPPHLISSLFFCVVFRFFC
jgi:hypothetical protein